MNFNTSNQSVQYRWLPPKILLVMKITTVLLLAIIMQVSASTYGQRITLSEKNTPLEQVLKKVKLQSGYDFLYGGDILLNTRKVSVQIKNQPLEIALNEILEGQSLIYVIGDQTIVIKKEPTSFIDKLKDFVTAVDIRGKVLDEKGNPLPGAVVKVKGGSTTYSTDNNGNFLIKNVAPDAVLQISYMGYRMKELKAAEIKGFTYITMELMDTSLDEVNIYSTGYQKLPKERATGSFEQVNNELFNRSAGTDVISRLNGVTTSTIFGRVSNVPTPFSPVVNSNGVGRKFTQLDQLTIRGISTLTTTSGSMAPLIILDNFPYDGDPNNINPNDVENVTLLRDAAASSIWGLRASNGVIVITTKKPKYDQAMRLSLNTNLSVSEKPDLFYQKRMSSTDYIDIEKFLFNKGTFNTRINAPIFSPVTPVVDLLAKQRALPTTDLQGRAAIDRQIDAYRNYDSRNDILKYLYREPVNQQYALNVTGGSKNLSYLLSGGFDKNLGADIDIDYQRINLRSNTTLKPIKDLEVQADIFYTRNQYHSPAGLAGSDRILNHLPVEPYLRLADDQGNHLEVINPTNVNFSTKSSYRRTAGNGRLLNWIYTPLDDIGTSSADSKSQNILMNLGLNYRFNPVFTVLVNYQYGKNTEEAIVYNSIDSYPLRTFINGYAIYSTTDLTAAPTFNIPKGGKLSNPTLFSLTNSLRGQVNFSKTWMNLHELTAIAGVERREVHEYRPPSIDLYGYIPDPLSYKLPAYSSTTPFPQLNNQGGSAFFTGPDVIFPISMFNRSTSIFMNAAYTYKSRYTLSASARKDAANILGVSVNQRGQPTWSAGMSWNISNEPFFKPSIVQSLKLRATYGYMGNVNNSVSAFPIITYAGQNPLGLNFATVNNPPNPSLGPERSGMINLGLDFALRKNRLSGTIEYYDKRSINLIAPTPLDLSTGFTMLNVNSARLKTTGIDLNLRSINLDFNHFQWNSNLLFSYTHNIVTKYLFRDIDNASSYVSFGDGSIPEQIYIEGNDPFSLYTFKWAGLDPNTGDPMGYDPVTGQPSKDYGKLLGVKYYDLQNNGSVIPLYYGGFKNDFNWNSFALSVNILYKFGYKLNPKGINYAQLFTTTVTPYADYARRWQKPGDEKITNVPSMVYPIANVDRELFYQSSSARVISGNHIRLQDIRLSYAINKPLRYFCSLQIYANVSNLGIIWKANKADLDPEVFMSLPMPKTITMGVNLGF